MLLRCMDGLCKLRAEAPSQKLFFCSIVRAGKSARYTSFEPAGQFKRERAEGSKHETTVVSSSNHWKFCLRPALRAREKA